MKIINIDRTRRLIPEGEVDRLAMPHIVIAANANSIWESPIKDGDADWGTAKLFLEQLVFNDEGIAVKELTLFPSKHDPFFPLEPDYKVTVWVEEDRGVLVARWRVDDCPFCLGFKDEGKFPQKASFDKAQRECY